MTAVVRAVDVKPIRFDTQNLMFAERILQHMKLIINFKNKAN